MFVKSTLLRVAAAGTILSLAAFPLAAAEITPTRQADPNQLDYKRRMPIVDTGALVELTLSGSAGLITVPGAPPMSMADALAGLAAHEYNFVRHDGAFVAPNRTQDLRARISESGIDVTPRTSPDAWTFGMSLEATGRDHAMTAAAPATFRSLDPLARRGRPSPTGRSIGPARGTVREATFGDALAVAAGLSRRVELARPGLTEWYVNDEKGFEQGFTFQAPPAGDTSLPVVLKLSLRGTLQAELGRDAGALTLRDSNGFAVLGYEGLHVYDSAGQVLLSWLSLSPSGLEIKYDDRGAVYPVVVDPLIATPSSQVIVGGDPGMQLGFSVAGGGDVNNDGLEDVLVGAPKFGGGPADGEGLYAVFLGSGTPGVVTLLYSLPSSGLGAIGAVPQPIGPVDLTGEELGHLVAFAGDINNDGFDDIIVGAPRWDNGAPVLAPMVPHEDAGRAFIIRNGAGGFPIAAQVSQTNQGKLGPGDGELRGWAGSQIGDFNGDGFGDFTIGRRGLDAAAGAIDSGGVTFFLGTPGAAVAAFAFTVGQAGAHDGSALSWSDINNDGLGDSLEGAPDFDTPQGSVDSGSWGVTYGLPGTAPGVYPGLAFSFYFPNPIWEGDHVGFSIGGGGDVDGDGNLDYLLGVPFADSDIVGTSSNSTNDVGAVLSFHGKNNAQPTDPGTLDDVLGSGSPQDNAHFGWAVNNDGNADCDIYSDGIIGSPDWDVTLFGSEGLAEVFPGSSSGLDDGVINWQTVGFAVDSLHGTSVDWARTDSGTRSSGVVGAPGEGLGGVVRLYRPDPAEDCSQQQACPCDGFDSHGGYVSCVAHYRNENGPTGRDGGAFVSAAARSGCSK